MGHGNGWWGKRKNNITTIIREYTHPQDYAAVLEIWNNAGHGINVRRSDQPEEIAKKIQRDPDLFLLAVEEGRIIGTVLGGYDGRRGIMYHLAVVQEKRQSGIGALLMEELEKRLRAKGCLKYYLLVLSDNEEAIRFYEKRGWERMELFIYGKEL